MTTRTKKLTAKEEKKQVEKIMLSSLSREELSKKADALRKEIQKTRLEIKIGRERNVRKAFNLRKELARVLTMLMVK